MMINTDNMVTEWCIRRWRAKKEMLQIIRKIRMFALERDIHLMTQHIPGMNNKVADSLSRMSMVGDYQVK